jgi:FkbM family methyltransferase
VTTPQSNGVHAVKTLKYDFDFQDEIQRAVFLGVYERHDLNFVTQVVQPHFTCLDIGANIGFYTLNLSRLTPSGRVYSVEPDATNFRKLLSNLQLNKMSTEYASNVAISSQCGNLEFTKSLSQNSGWGRLGQWEEGGEKVSVRALTLDKFMEERKIDFVDFMKIDIEGHELELLKGGILTFTSGKVRRLFIEYCGYSLEPKGIVLKDYIAAIEPYGFRPKYLEMDRVRAAKAGHYSGERRTTNLYFEWEPK